jgi:hypothetical protein
MAPPALPIEQILLQQSLAGVPAAEQAVAEQKAKAALDVISRPKDSQNAWYRTSIPGKTLTLASWPYRAQGGIPARVAD